MESLLIVIPVFALIATGLIATLTGLLSADAQRGIAAFTFNIAIPALLMRTVATAELQEIRPFAIWAAYFGAIAIIWVISRLITGFALRRTSADGVTIALGSVYGNIVMLGIPLCVAVLGEESVGPMAVILAVNTPVQWLLATPELTVAERRRETSLTEVVYDVCIELVRNPIVIGIVIGTFIVVVTIIVRIIIITITNTITTNAVNITIAVVTVIVIFTGNIIVIVIVVVIGIAIDIVIARATVIVITITVACFRKVS